MNLITISFSLFATTCLVSVSSSDASSDTSSKSPKFLAPVDVYGVGCELALVEGTLVTNIEYNMVSMSVNVKKLKEIVNDKRNEHAPLSVLPKLFNMELLKKKIALLTKKMVLDSKTIDFNQFRWCLSDCALIPEATIVADVAIFKWIVQTIKSKKARVVNIDPYDLKVVCSLSLTTHIGPDYTEDLSKVLEEIPKLLPSLVSVSVNNLTYSLIALLKHLQSHSLYKRVENIAEGIFSSLEIEDGPLYQKFGFCCVMVLGMDHPFMAKLAGYVSEKQLAIWNTKAQEFSFKRDFKAFSLGSEMKLIDDGFHGAWNHVSPYATIGSDQELEWEDRLAFLRPAALNPNQKYLCMSYNVALPQLIWNEIKSNTSLEELRSYLTKPETIRLLLLYKVTIFTKNFKPQIS